MTKETDRDSKTNPFDMPSEEEKKGDEKHKNNVLMFFPVKIPAGNDVPDETA